MYRGMDREGMLHFTSSVDASVDPDERRDERVWTIERTRGYVDESVCGREGVDKSEDERVCGREGMWRRGYGQVRGREGMDSVDEEDILKGSG